MSVTIIGSVAMRRNGINVDRKTVDIDIIGSYSDCYAFMKANLKEITSIYPIKEGNKLIAKGIDENNNFAVVEAEIFSSKSTAKMVYDLIANDDDTIHHGDSNMIASVNMLYFLKMSHRYLKNSPHFNKTMDDIHALRNAGAFIPKEWNKAFKAREKATYVYKHPKLNTSKDSFFNGDGVKYVYDHDSIHEAVKHLDKPAYTYFKPDENEVYCDKELFNNCPEEVKLYSVLEESYVLSLERSLIPFKGKADPEWAFNTSLMKVCTSIASGWWREYAWENYHKVKALMNMEYVDRFWKEVDRNNVKPYTGTAY